MGLTLGGLKCPLSEVWRLPEGHEPGFENGLFGEVAFEVHWHLRGDPPTALSILVIRSVVCFRSMDNDRMLTIGYVSFGVTHGALG